MIQPAILAALPAGGGPAPYHADAVHFDGATFLTIGSLVATDNGDIGYSFWYKAATQVTSKTLWVSDPDNYCMDFILGGGFVCDFSSAACGITFSGLMDQPAADTWHNIIVAAKTDLGSGLKQLKIYLDNVETGAITADDGIAFNMAFNGLSFWLGGDGGGSFATADIADFRIAPAQAWLTAGDISPATRALIIDPITLKPVDPAVATASLGAPCMLFSGPASTFGTNQGTGGAFTTTGTLTNASTSPSD